jgi:hypothetical protein
LATAAAIVGQKLKSAGLALGLETFLFSRELIQSVVYGAEALEAHMAKDPQFPAKADQLIRIRLN